MSAILVTGSTDGLGRLTAESLLAAGHQVVVHTRNRDRVDALGPLVVAGARLVVADLGVRDDVLRMAAELADAELAAVIHNAGVGVGVGGGNLLAVNLVAPYLLTALLSQPSRHVYLSSSMHRGGKPRVAGLDWQGSDSTSYSDSKLLVTALSMAVARRRTDILSNAVDPGWVPTRMGGPGAPDDLTLGHRTQEWLVTSDDAEARTSGGYWHHQRRQDPHPATLDLAFQDELIAALAAETGVEFIN